MKKPTNDFSKFIAVSVAFHAVIFIFLTVKILFFPSEELDLKSAVKIDVVALPDKQVTPPSPPAEEKKPEPVAKKEETKPKPIVKKEKPKPKPKPKPKKKTVNLEQKKKKKKKKIKEAKNEQDSALARLKAMQKLKNKAKPKKQEFKGNAVSKGNSLSGLDKLHDDSYKGDLENHIKSHWVLPEWLRDGNYQASVIVLISKTGNIISKTFIAQSGNKLFDEQVLSTLEKANPLPKPPSKLVDLYSNKGVQVNFP